MYPPAFDYYRAQSPQEAVELLQEHESNDPHLLAGGHSLLPLMKQRLSSPGVLIDIGRIESLKGISTDGDSIVIGALTTHAELAGSDELWDSAPGFAEAASEVGDIQVRNRGTIGGNLAHADPASDLPAPFLAFEGTAVVQGPSGERTIDAEDFFLGFFMTGVEEDEIVLRFEIPRHSDTETSAYVKNASPSSGYAIVGVCAVLDVQDGTIASARLAANGVMDRPVRLSGLEEELQGKPATAEAIEDASEHATDGLNVDDMLSNQEASSEYRETLVRAYAKRALNRALDRT